MEQPRYGQQGATVAWSGAVSAPGPVPVTYGDAMDPSAVWRDRQHQWRIEAYRAPDLRFAIYATNGPTESVPLWLFGMTALARWLMTHSISLDDLEVD